ncbi:MAG: hypothetical protein RL368_1495 [Pseudomonadota bacterium]
MQRVVYFLCLLFSLPVFAGSREALVIGNTHYAAGYDLGKNPLNDAKEMGALFRALNFKVTVKTDLSREEMEEEIREFGKRLSEGGVAAFYFSGHGVQNEGENYLLPIEGTRTISAKGHLKDKAVSVNYVLSVMEEKKGTNLVFLDACRDNPFKGLFKGNASVGLATQSNTPNGTLISYATGANKQAVTGTGENSPYVMALKQYLKPNITVTQALNLVRVAVQSATDKQQAPAFYSELNGDFCLLEPCGSGSPVAETPAAPAYVPPVSKPAPVVSRLEFEPEMVLIPAGTFEMGSNDHHDNEKPVHAWKMGSFWMSKYEVTLGQFKTFVQETGYTGKVSETYCNGLMNPKGLFTPADNHPVSCVHWKDAEAYTAWLSQKTGKEYRLPTEAEWEYAARAGSMTKWYFGNDVNRLAEYAWYDNNSGGHTHAVGQKKPNDFGLYDMAGNVWEWTCSERGDYTDGKDAKCASGGDSRLLRGGAWNSVNSSCHSSYRGVYFYNNNLWGFRVVFPAS